MEGHLSQLTLAQRTVEELRDPLAIDTRRRIEDPAHAILEHPAAMLAILSACVACVERAVQLLPAVLPADGPGVAMAGRVKIIDEERDDDAAFFVVVRGWVGERRRGLWLSTSVS